ncbi:MULTISPECIES: AMP-binding protein [unclassified Variovorax]|uniref:AMP-binding protein n=1 Tax=unclassified Variovorax TaxID=663243 RepID=UPI003F47FD72
MLNAPSSVYQAFRQTADRTPQAPFVHIPATAAASYARGPLDLTYGEAARLTESLVPSYRESGLRTGHRVALLLDNRADFFVHWLALNALGISIVPLNAEGSTADMAHVVRDSGVAMAVALPERRALLEAAAPTLPVHVIDSDPPHCLQASPNSGRDECSLVYTSGSTGAPKGCMLSNRYFLAFGTWYINVGGLCHVRNGEERLITPLPLTHMNALACSTMAMVLSGGCIVQLDRFHPRSWWQVVAESRATIVHYLGVMPAMLLQIPQGEHERRHALRFGFGAGVHPSHHKAFEERFGFPLLESWSMTEVGAGAAMVASEEPRHVGTRCFGRPTNAMEYRLVTPDGNQVLKGATGELQVRAAGEDARGGFFSGYAGQSVLTEEAWSDGWFRTGDMVREGDDGSLHFVDRSKSIVRRSGENIASLEVEGVLNQIAGVRAVGVGPVDDELRGEEVMACIELAEGVAPTIDTARQIFDSAGKKLTYFKVPGYIAFVAALPLTTSQKLQRGELKTMARLLVQSGNVFDLRYLKKRSSRGQH